LSVAVNYIYIHLFLLEKIGCVSTSLSAGSRDPALFGTAVLLLCLGVNHSLLFDRLVSN
jgi:hypothetical protein